MAVAAIAETPRERSRSFPTYENASRRRELAGTALAAFVRRRPDGVRPRRGTDGGARICASCGLPFEDHPVRAPGERQRVRRRGAPGSAVVLLGALPGAPVSALRESRARWRSCRTRSSTLRGDAFDAWEAAAERKRRSRSSTRALRDAWRELDEAVASPNPLFDRQRAALRGERAVRRSPSPFSRAARAAFTACSSLVG